MAIPARKPVSLFVALGALPVAAILPLLLFAAMLLLLLWDGQRDESRRDLQQAVRTLSVAVEREIDGSVRQLDILASLPALDDPSTFPVFHAFARAMLASSDQWLDITLVGPDGERLVDAAQPWGMPAARLKPPHHEEVLRTGRPVVSGLRGADPGVEVSVPVRRGGEVRWVLSARLDPEKLSALLQQQLLRTRAVATLLDGGHRVIARSREHLLHFGKQPPAETLARFQAGPEGGVSDMDSLDGVPMVVGWQRLPFGWTVSSGVPSLHHAQSLARSIQVLGVVGAGLLALGVLASFLLGRRISAEIDTAAADARLLADGEPIMARRSRFGPLARLREALLEAEHRLQNTLSERAALLVAERQARSRAERLQALSAALGAARGPEEVAEAILRVGMPALSAQAATVVLPEPGRPAGAPPAFRVVAAEGWPSGTLDDWLRLPMHVQSPMAEAIDTREPVWAESHEDLLRRFPAMRRLAAATGFGGWMALPFVSGTHVLGGFGLAFHGNRSIGNDERELLAAMARQCAQALERARLDEAEREARAQAEAASRAKDEFLAMLGHELRNPLSAVINATRLLRHPRLPDAERGRLVDMVDRQSGQLKRLVDDLLDVGRVLSGKIRILPAPADLGDVARRAVEALQAAGRFEQHTLDVEWMMAPVTGDMVRLEQVVSNLLTNAIRYTPAGGHVGVQVRVEDDWAVLRVHDTGVGIEPALLPRIFDLFVQGDQDLHRSTGGLGIGLTLVRKLVEMQGGRVRADSAGAGQGATFTVRLPLRRDAVDAAGAASVATTAIAEAAASARAVQSAVPLPPSASST